MNEVLQQQIDYYSDRIIYIQNELEEWNKRVAELENCGQITIKGEEDNEPLEYLPLPDIPSTV